MPQQPWIFSGTIRQALSHWAYCRHAGSFRSCTLNKSHALHPLFYCLPVNAKMGAESCVWLLYILSFQKRALKPVYGPADCLEDCREGLSSQGFLEQCPLLCAIPYWKWSWDARRCRENILFGKAFEPHRYYQIVLRLRARARHRAHVKRRRHIRGRSGGCAFRAGSGRVWRLRGLYIRHNSKRFQKASRYTLSAVPAKQAQA